MKIGFKHIFPGLFGLFVYVIIRVINDTISHFRFWRRDWWLNIGEIAFCVATGYILLYALRWLFRRFDQTLQKNIGYKTVLNELLWVCVVTELVVNAVITPFVALTDDGLSWGDFATINIIPLLFCLLYYVVMRSNKLFRAYVDNKLQLEKLTNDHLQTELKFLKAQYHPHFLFNALNTVYFQMDENVAEAKKSIEKFSELLRYQLYDQQQTVPVSREIHYLENFIELQKMRSSDRLQLQVQFDPALNGQEVYPLLFLPLVENAFKYVGGDYRIDIAAKKSGGYIYFSVENSVPAGYNPDILQSAAAANGIGLENLKRRLALLYPGKHQFTSEKRGDRFFAELKLELNEKRS